MGTSSPDRHPRSILAGIGKAAGVVKRRRERHTPPTHPHVSHACMRYMRMCRWCVPFSPPLYYTSCFADTSQDGPWVPVRGGSPHPKDRRGATIALPGAGQAPRGLGGHPPGTRGHSPPCSPPALPFPLFVPLLAGCCCFFLPRFRTRRWCGVVYVMILT